MMESAFAGHRVRQLARRAHSIKDSDRMLGVFETYLDESGIGKQFFAVGGLVGPADEWAQFADEWHATIRRLSISAYHAADCEVGRGEFSGWPQDKRQELTVNLIDCILRRKVFAVCLSAVVAGFQEVFNPRPENLWRDLYTLLLRHVIATAVREMSQRAPGPAPRSCV